MNRTSRVRTLSGLKAMVSMKSVYTLAFALLLASGILVAFPPASSLAANCSASCGQGETITITGATSCSCTDNQGCTWTFAGKSYAQTCGTVPIT
jgi:hypothetical protein